MRRTAGLIGCVRVHEIVLDSASGLQTLHGVEETAGIGGRAHEVGRLAEGLEVGQRDDYDGLVPGAGDHDLLAIVDHRVEDFCVPSPGLGVAHGLHGASCTGNCTLSWVGVQACPSEALICRTTSFGL
jgi:hypothetical protein